jgi:hypothetical protein
MPAPEDGWPAMEAVRECVGTLDRVILPTG